MKKSMKPALFWAPRVLGIVFALFLGVLALDLFNEVDGVWRTALALGVHLIPAAIILIVVTVSWRRAWVGGFVLPALGLWYLLSESGRIHWSVYLVISGPLFVTGVLFLSDWIYGVWLRRARASV
jgi:hypothetical protein